MSLNGKVKELIITKRYKHILSDRAIMFLICNMILANGILINNMNHNHNKKEFIHEENSIKHDSNSEYVQQRVGRKHGLRVQTIQTTKLP